MVLALTNYSSFKNFALQSLDDKSVELRWSSEQHWQLTG